MICFPNAKINLGLHIINRRNDGFHNIETVFYPVNFYDMLEIVKSKKSKSQKVEFSSDGIKIVGEEKNNLVIKAYNLLDDNFSLDPVKIFLYKRIPMGAGLGGGSSDAAFAIKLLNDIFGLKISINEMKKFASQLGSDCAFFIENNSAYVYGTGNELESISLNLERKYFVLVKPDIHSSTAVAYFNAISRGIFDEKKSIKNLLQLPIEQWKENIKNDFEYSVFPEYPLLSEIKKMLYDAGAVYAAMSGSGSALYGIFKSEPKLSEKLEKFIIYSGKLN